MAYRALLPRACGKRSGRLQIGATRRTLSLVVAHAALALRAQARLFVERFQSPQAAVMDTGCDATPFLLSFGNFATRVAGHARYFVPTGDRSGWTSVTLEDFRGLGRRSAPHFGTLEVFAGTSQVRWAAGGRRRGLVARAPSHTSALSQDPCASCRRSVFVGLVWSGSEWLAQALSPGCGRGRERGSEGAREGGRSGGREGRGE